LHLQFAQHSILTCGTTLTCRRNWWRAAAAGARGRVTLVGSALFSSTRLLDCRDSNPIAIRREEMVEEQRRREQEEARNLRAAQDLSRMSLSPADSGPPPPPQHYPQPSFSVRKPHLACLTCAVSNLHLLPCKHERAPSLEMRLPSLRVCLSQRTGACMTHLTRSSITFAAEPTQLPHEKHSVLCRATSCRTRIPRPSAAARPRCRLQPTRRRARTSPAAMAASSSWATGSSRRRRRSRTPTRQPARATAPAAASSRTTGRTCRRRQGRRRCPWLCCLALLILLLVKGRSNSWSGAGLRG